MSPLLPTSTVERRLLVRRVQDRRRGPAGHQRRGQPGAPAGRPLPRRLRVPAGPGGLPAHPHHREDLRRRDRPHLRPSHSPGLFPPAPAALPHLQVSTNVDVGVVVGARHPLHVGLLWLCHMDAVPRTVLQLTAAFVRAAVQQAWRGLSSFGQGLAECAAAAEGHMHCSVEDLKHLCTATTACPRGTHTATPPAPSTT